MLHQQKSNLHLSATAKTSVVEREGLGSRACFGTLTLSLSSGTVKDKSLNYSESQFEMKKGYSTPIFLS